jgi:hypothetical protein
MAEIVKEAIDRGIDRRKLLKGAAAVGVGVTAWSVPDITSLGSTPVYAQVCTAPVTYYEASNRNTSCSCGTPNQGIKHAKYSKFKTACAGTTYPGVVELRSGSCTGALIGESGECAPPEGAAGVCVGNPPGGQTCRIVVRAEQGNCGAVLISQVVGENFTTPTWTKMPVLDCAGQANIFVRVRIACSRDPFCLPENIFPTT